VNQTVRPNLFVVGAMRSGTTTFHRHLLAHPQVFMSSDPKEPSYFLTREQLLDVQPGLERRGFWRGEERYLELFKDAGNAPVVGEASANYARLPRVGGVAERVCEFNPQARIIYLMRDPVERTISHYWYMVRHFGETRDPLTALREEPDYTATSHYALQLRPWLQCFGTTNVYVLTMEQLLRDPQATMSQVYYWLGVDPGFVLPNPAEHQNAAPLQMRQVRGAGHAQRFRHSALWNAIGPLVPARLRRLGRGLSERKVARTAVDLGPVRSHLVELHTPQVRQLEALLGQEYPEWTSVAR
jgi:hypothetical protein